MKSYLKIAFTLLACSVSASHLDDIDDLEKFSWDTVKFKTKKDCSLDAHPDVSKITRFKN